MKICPFCSKPIEENLYSFVPNPNLLVSCCLDCDVGWVDDKLFAHINPIWQEMKGTLLIRKETPEELNELP